MRKHSYETIPSRALPSRIAFVCEALDLRFSILNASDIWISLVHLHIVGREQATLALEVTKPPILVGELQVRDLRAFREAKL